VIDNCFSTGKITGSATVGGLVGRNPGSVTGSFWDTVTSNQSLSSGGTGKNTTAMISSSTFGSWDMSSKWNIIDARNYPFLRWLPQGDPTITTMDSIYALEELSYRTDYDARDDPVSEEPLHWFMDEGPGWLDIDLYSGVLSGTPGNLGVGTSWVNVSVYDGTGAFNHTRFRLTVNNTNDPVFIISEPPINATEDLNYTYVIEVQDDDLLNPSGETLTFYLEEGPEGMHINRDNGTVWWIPTNEQAERSYNVTVNVTDGEVFDKQRWNITVENSNDPVMLWSDPVLNSTEDEEYNYFLNVTDDDLVHPGEQLYYDLEVCPEHMNIGHTWPGMSLFLVWWPTYEDVGRYHDVVLNITDGETFVVQQFQIWVKNRNDRPVINTSKMDNAVEDVPYSFQILAWDEDFLVPEGEILHYSLQEAPGGMTIDNSTGMIDWIPTNLQAAQEHVVKVKVSDDELNVSKTFTIFVNNTNDPPQFNSTPPMDVNEDEEYAYDPQVWDEDLLNPSGEELSISLDVHPGGMEYSPFKGITWVPDLSQADQVHPVVINVSDGEIFALQYFNITVHRVTPEMFKVTLGPLLYVDDSPAAGINMTITFPGIREYTNFTDEDGMVTFFDVFPGEYTVTIEGQETDYYAHLTVDEYGNTEYVLPKIALPTVVDDDIIDDDTDDDIVDDDADDSDTTGNKSDIIWIIATVVVVILAIAGVLILLLRRRGSSHPEE